MAEFVQRRKEEMIKEIPVLQSHFKSSTLKRLLKQREKFEYRLMRRIKQKSDFTQYIEFLNSIVKKVEKMGTQNTESLKLIGQHKKQIIFLYRAALKYFKDDVSLWIEYIKFLMKANKIRLLQTVLDSALLLHGHISDELYVFAVKQEFMDIKNIQKAREMYTVGLCVHKNSSALYFEAFKCELAFTEKLIKNFKKTGNEFNVDDPALNGSIAKVIFESAKKNVKNDSNLFFKMFKKASAYNFASHLSTEINKFMLNTFSLDSNYWDTLATNELLKSNNTEKIRIKKCLDKYDEALSLIDTQEMWNRYLTTILKLTSDTNKTEVYKRNLLRQSMYNAHMKNKLYPTHYIQWINKSDSSMIEEILQLAQERHPNDSSILELKLNHLAKVDKTTAYKLFLQCIPIVTPNIWIIMVECFSNEPLLNDIFNMVFGDKSVCTNEVKQKLANKYLYWLSKNKTLNDTRNVYNKMILNSSCDPGLCKTIVTIETEQKKPDISKIRQHFTLACMQFGKTNIDLWMERIYFELKFGSPKMVSSIYHQALTTLNNEESDRFAEEYMLKIIQFNKPPSVTG